MTPQWLQEHTFFLYSLTDGAGVIRYANDNFCRLSGYAPAELVGQEHRLLASGYHEPGFFRDLWRTIGQGATWRGAIRNRAKDGRHYWVDTTIVPVLDGQGRPHQYVAVYHDITRWKDAEEELLRRNERLEERVEARTSELAAALERVQQLGTMSSRFVSVAAHEFRTPLSTILSGIELIGHYDAPAQARLREKHLARVRRAVAGLTQLLNDLLVLEPLTAPSTAVRPERFDLRNFLGETVAEVRAAALRKRQRIALRYEGAPWLCQDRALLRKILLHLLSNALHYSPEGAPVRLHAAVDAQGLRLLVCDEGIGIPVVDQPFLFEMFYRAGNATHLPGAGLGLSIVKRYVELLRGRIHFRSTEKEGSTFTIELPDLPPA